tara:strand:- start:1718 stop:1912 length:195 start_codon:yes stop_codon:yes gene_type:complete
MKVGDLVKIKFGYFNRVPTAFDTTEDKLYTPGIVCDLVLGGDVVGILQGQQIWWAGKECVEVVS